MKRTLRITTLGSWCICLAMALLATAQPSEAQAQRHPAPRYSRYPTETAERYDRPARQVMYQEPADERPMAQPREAGPARESAPVRTTASSNRPSSNVQMGYRSTPTRVAQTPAWQRRPDTQMAGRIQPRTISTEANVFPFEEDRVEQVQPGRPMPHQDAGPQDFGPMDEGYMDGEPMYDGEYMEGDWMEEGFTYGGGWRSACCNGPDPMACERYAACSPWSFLNEMNLSVGVHAFKGPIDFGRVGNFGFNQAVSLSDSIWHSMGIGYQAGIRFAESNFNGDQANPFQPRVSTRYQTFTTVGLFHRAFYGCGWQYGAVFDYMTDRYYFDNGQTAGLAQVRAELSYIWSNGHEIGFTGMVGTQDKNVVVNAANFTLLAMDQYRGFYRVNFDDGAYARLWAGGLGGAGAANVVVGSDFRVPVANRFDITGT
jgi:hypothetical protein